MNPKVKIKNLLPYLILIILIGAIFWVVPYASKPILRWVGTNDDLIDTISSLLTIISILATFAYFIYKTAYHKKTLTPTKNLIPAPEPEVLPAITYPQNILAARNNVDQLMNWHEYDSAVQESQKYLEDLFSTVNLNDPGVILVALELRVDYGRALMYIGKIDDAITELNNVIETVNNRYEQLIKRDPSTTNLILGLAHNHKGYIYWMEFSSYEYALVEMGQASQYLQDHHDDLATVLDNIGRIYSQLGYHSQAEYFVLQGLSIRIKTGDEYRKALSLNSLAIVLLASGNPQRSSDFARLSFGLFSKVYKGNTNQQQSHELTSPRQSGVRGMGLAAITLGQALRSMGNYWKESENDAELERQSLIFLNESASEFEFAFAIFKGENFSSETRLRLDKETIHHHVSEPLRRYQALNEMGCTYREISQLNRAKNRPSSQAERDSRKCLKSKYVQEIENSSIVHYVDSSEDAARLSYVCNDFEGVIEQIRIVEQEVEKRAQEHLIIKGQMLQNLPAEKCYEELWRHLAKLYILRGQTKLKQVSKSVDKLSGTMNAIEDYFLASLYLQRFLQRPINSWNSKLYPTTYSPQYFRSSVTKQLINDLTSFINTDAASLEIIERQIAAIRIQYDYPQNEYWFADITDALNILSLHKGRSISAN
jgi:tetratricopeptide (TPR) repeat protein